MTFSGRLMIASMRPELISSGKGDRGGRGIVGRLASMRPELISSGKACDNQRRGRSWRASMRPELISSGKAGTGGAD